MMFNSNSTVGEVESEEYLAPYQHLEPLGVQLHVSVGNTASGTIGLATNYEGVRAVTKLVVKAAEPYLFGAFTREHRYSFIPGTLEPTRGICTSFLHRCIRVFAKDDETLKQDLLSRSLSLVHGDNAVDVTFYSKQDYDVFNEWVNHEWSMAKARIQEHWKPRGSSHKIVQAALQGRPPGMGECQLEMNADFWEDSNWGVLPELMMDEHNKLADDLLNGFHVTWHSRVLGGVSTKSTPRLLRHNAHSSDKLVHLEPSFAGLGETISRPLEDLIQVGGGPSAYGLSALLLRVTLHNPEFRACAVSLVFSDMSMDLTCATVQDARELVLFFSAARGFKRAALSPRSPARDTTRSRLAPAGRAEDEPPRHDRKSPLIPSGGGDPARGAPRDELRRKALPQENATATTSALALIEKNIFVSPNPKNVEDLAAMEHEPSSASSSPPVSYKAPRTTFNLTVEDLQLLLDGSEEDSPIQNRRESEPYYRTRGGPLALDERTTPSYYPSPPSPSSVQTTTPPTPTPASMARNSLGRLDGGRNPKVDPVGEDLGEPSTPETKSGEVQRTGDNIRHSDDAANDVSSCSQNLNRERCVESSRTTRHEQQPRSVPASRKKVEKTGSVPKAGKKAGQPTLREEQRRTRKEHDLPTKKAPGLPALEKQVAVLASTRKAPKNSSSGILRAQPQREETASESTLGFMAPTRKAPKNSGSGILRAQPQREETASESTLGVIAGSVPHALATTTQSMPRHLKSSEKGVVPRSSTDVSPPGRDRRSSSPRQVRFVPDKEELAKVETGEIVGTQAFPPTPPARGTTADFPERGLPQSSRLDLEGDGSHLDRSTALNHGSPRVQDEKKGTHDEQISRNNLPRSSGAVRRGLAV